MLNEKYQKLFEALQDKFKDALILSEEPMKAHTTFRIGGPADIYIEPDYPSIIPLIEFLREWDAEFIVIGNGSNILVSDQGVEGVVKTIATHAFLIDFMFKLN